MTNANQQPNTADALHQEALALLKSGKLKDGIAVLEKALELNPGSGDMHNDMATAIWQTNNMELARTHFDKAIKLESTRPHIFNNYGYFLMEAGNPVAAERMLKKAVDLKPDFIEAISNLGQCLQTLGKFDSAEKVYLAAIRLKPELPETHFNIGTLYTKMDMTARAEAAFKKTIQLAPGHFRSWFEIARIYYDKNDIDQCLDCLYKSKAINQKFRPAWSQLILVLTERGDQKAADEIAEKALAIFPNDPPLILDRAANLRQQGRHQEALDLIEKINKIAIDWPRTHFEKAHNFQALRQTDRAFIAYCQGNATRKARAESLAPILKLIKDSQSIFTKNWVQSWTTPQIESLNIKPIFVVRFPGAAVVTLPAAFFNQPAVELTHGVPAISNVVRYLSDVLAGNYPAGIASLTDEHITQARRIYVECLRAAGLRLPPGDTVIDTSPVNMIHAGLIHRLFPEASFLLVQAHPYDEVLSSFMENPLAHDVALRSFDLAEAARLYGHSFRLWEHYRATLPLSLLPGAKAENTDLWKTYKPFIEGIFPILEPWAEKYGYAVK